MDMPSRCGECAVCHMVGSNALCQAEIGATYTVGRLTATYTKPDWCPLRKVPDYFIEDGTKWVEGYNACIYGILEEE